MAESGGHMGKLDPSAFIVHDDGGAHVAAPKLKNNKKSNGILSRVGSEFFGAVGFVAMFAAIGGLIPAIATGAFAAGTLATAGLGFAIAITAMFAAAVIKKRVEDKTASAGAEAGKEARVIIQNLQIQPNIEIEHKQHFAKMIEDERAQSSDQAMTRH